MKKTRREVIPVNAGSKWMILGLVTVIALVVLLLVANHTITTNNTERDRIRTTAGLIGPYEGTCVVNSTGNALVLSCKFGLNPLNTE